TCTLAVLLAKMSKPMITTNKLRFSTAQANILIISFLSIESFTHLIDVSELADVAVPYHEPRPADCEKSGIVICDSRSLLKGTSLNNTG
ncbi:MAG: hypothetical protein ACI945_002313, partial [Pseudohongiellaceae bacterium]